MMVCGTLCGPPTSAKGNIANSACNLQHRVYYKAEARRPPREETRSAASDKITLLKREDMKKLEDALSSDDMMHAPLHEVERMIETVYTIEQWPHTIADVLHGVRDRHDKAARRPHRRICWRSDCRLQGACKWKWHKPMDPARTAARRFDSLHLCHDHHAHGPRSGTIRPCTRSSA